MNVRANSKASFRAVLESELGRRQRKNKAYSLRAFAKDLQVDSSTLSAVLKGKRRLPQKKAEQIADRLGLSPLQRTGFLESLRMSQSVMKGIQVDSLLDHPHVLNAEADYKIIAEWEHYAVLSLVLTQGFQPNVDFIARRLGITSAQANDVMRRLIQAGLLTQDENGKFKPSYRRINTTDGIPSQALRKAHKEAMEMGIEKIDSVPLKYHSYSSETIAFNKNRIQEAKALIQEFRERFNALMTDTQADEVYQLCLQFYPLTQLNLLEEENEKP